MAHKCQCYITLTEQYGVVATLYTGIREVPPSNLARKTGFPYNVFRRFRKIAKVTIIFVSLFVCLSTWNDSAHTGRIFIIFDI
jgi:hypothetical protein